MVVFTKEFGTLDPHLPIVWDEVPKKNGFFYTFPYYKYSCPMSVAVALCGRDNHPLLEGRSGSPRDERHSDHSCSDFNMFCFPYDLSV